jgi:putative acetyltransferase
MSEYHRLHNEDHLLIRPIKPEDDTSLQALRQLLSQRFSAMKSTPVSPASDQDYSSVSLYELYQVPAGEKPDRGYWVLVDERDSRIMGGIGFAAQQQETASHTCELQNLFLHPDLHGCGVGRKLVEYCMREAAKAGYRQMYLESSSSARNELDLTKNSGLRFFRTGRTVKITGINPT